MTFIAFLLAAAFEIGGCYLVWLALRNDQSWLWLPAIVALAVFGYLLTLSGTETAGRAFAVYGGVYIVASLFFMGLVEGVRPDRWDLMGGALALAGAAIVFFGPRSA